MKQIKVGDLCLVISGVNTGCVVRVIDDIGFIEKDKYFTYDGITYVSTQSIKSYGCCNVNNSKLKLAFGGNRHFTNRAFSENLLQPLPELDEDDNIDVEKEGKQNENVLV